MSRAVRIALFLVLAGAAVLLSACGDSITPTHVPSSTPNVVQPSVITGTDTTATGGVTVIGASPATTGNSPANISPSAATTTAYGNLPLTTSTQIGKSVTSIKSLIRYAISKELSAPGSAQGSATIGAEPYLLSAAWCAIDAATLAQNLKAITTRLSINDVQVPLDSFTASTQIIGGQSCRIYDIVVNNAPPGAYTITLAYVLATDVNDGSNNNPAGTYTYVAKITRP